MSSTTSRSSPTALPALARWCHRQVTASALASGLSFGALLLDIRGRVIGHLLWPEIDFQAFPVKKLFVPALLGAAASVALCYGPLPSVEPTEDVLVFARRMEKAGAVLGIPVTDFLLLGHHSSFLSLRRELGLGRDTL